MIDRGVPANRDGWPEGSLDALRVWEQGDIVGRPPFFYYADPSRPVWEETRAYTESSSAPELILPGEDACPAFGMITTQTCDIAEEDAHRPLRPWVQVAPVYQVTTWKRKKLERRTPLYWVLVPDLPGDDPWVADLRIEVPVEKGWLSQQERIEGFGDEARKRAIGEALARVRGRPAFSRPINRLINAVWTLLASEADQPEVCERTAETVEVVGLFLDSYLAPTRAQLIVLTNLALDAEAVEFLRQWNDEQAEILAENGVALQALDSRQMGGVSADEYRRLEIIWTAS